MKIIDAHIHFSDIAVFHDTAVLYAGVDYSARGLLDECDENNIIGLVGMGLNETARYEFPDKKANTPMGCDLTGPPGFLHVCLGINPHLIHIPALENALKEAAGIKIYAGYYHYYINDPVYDPVYRLAEKYGKPVVIHTGDTFSERGLLEYARPLPVDNLAARYRDVDFIIAHLGDPWIMEACEVVYKNKNVYADISGLVVGDAAEAERVKTEPLLRDRFRQGLVFLNQYEKIIYGSDWPLVSMAPYIDLCKALLPEKEWGKVFYKNALKIFSLQEVNNANNKHEG